MGKLETESKCSQEVKASIMKLEQEIMQMNGHIMHLTAQQNQIRDSREWLMDEGNAKMRAKDRTVEQISKLEADMEDLEAKLSGLEAKIAGYLAELTTPLTNGLTRDEEQLIVSLGKEVERQRKKMAEHSKKKNQVHWSLYDSGRRFMSNCSLRVGRTHSRLS